MHRATLRCLVLLGTTPLAPALLAQDQARVAVRFVPVDVSMDCAEAALAAYQLELLVEGEAQIVGVEGGSEAPFTQAPFYDPAALQGGRIVVAAFSTAAELPSRTPRLLTLHLREPGAAPTYRIRVIASVDRDGQPIACRFDLTHRSQP